MSIIHSELSSAMDQKLTATDTALKEGINQILRSRVRSESLLSLDLLLILCNSLLALFSDFSLNNQRAWE